ncbi:MAG: hypothetical protein N2444_01695, partial [Methylocystis sp.]|nr:hypothetical protein [Methylocystis sp.]
MTRTVARHNSSPRIGFVSIDGHDHWPGGRYYLQHIIRALALLPEGERPSMRDVWWRERDATDKSFDNVRDVMSAPVVVKPPTGAFARLMRRFSRDGNRRKDFGDLFRAADVDILFPTSACERPGVPLLYWLPDFQHKRRPDLNPAPLADWFDQNFQRMTEAAEFVLLSSRDALSDFKRYFPQFAHKGRALSAPSLPQPDWYECDPAKTARRLGLSERYFMICNQYTAHKNHLTVFEAVRRLKARGEDVQIVCTGHPVDYKAQDFGARLSRFIADNGLEQNIRLLGFCLLYTSPSPR